MPRRRHSSEADVVVSLAKLQSEDQAKSGNNGVPFTYTNPYASNSLDQVTYYLHDHLGNMRVTYTAGCKQEQGNAPYRELTLEHAADYHPYGSILREWRNGEAEKYLTTHHERDQETGLDYRGARYYDSDVARFLSLDPLAAKFASWSTYNFVLGNPVSFIDVDGREPREGNRVLRINMDVSFILAIGDQTPKYKTYDSNLRQSAAEYHAWHAEVRVGKSPAGALKIAKGAIETKRTLESIFGVHKKPTENGMQWLQASKSSTGYQYAEFVTGGLHYRHVQNLNEKLGVLEGYENVVTNRKTFALDDEGNSKMVREDWWNYRTRTTETGKTVIEYEHLFLDYTSDESTLNRSGWNEAKPALFDPKK